VLLSTSADEVLIAAETIGKELDLVQSETTADEFESLLIECNKSINDEIGLEYGDICDDGSDCC